MCGCARSASVRGPESPCLPSRRPGSRSLGEHLDALAVARCAAPAASGPRHARSAEKVPGHAVPSPATRFARLFSSSDAATKVAKRGSKENLLGSCNGSNGSGSSADGNGAPNLARMVSSRSSMRNNKMVVFVCTNLANLCCHAVYSVLASFFPQEAKSKGMSDDGVGFVFAVFAGIIFVFSPFAGRLMSRHGKVWVYIWGISAVSVSTICFSAASLFPAGVPFAAWCLAMRIIQGFGAALEETAMYSIIADLDPDRVTLYLGICEISTGLGYMVGPPLGGFLFAAGGFAMPFIILGLAVAPAALLLYSYVPPDVYRLSKGAPGPGLGEFGTRVAGEQSSGEVGMRTLLGSPQVMIMAIAAMLANSDYAFLEPTLGEHANAVGVASSPDQIGMLFSIAMTSYTLSCPVIGIVAKRENFGPRPVIVCGLMLQLLGFLIIGPSPLLRLEGRPSMGQMVVSLIAFGIGEAMSMTPVMDDMMHSCGTHAEEYVNGLSALMASAFSLGQMIGPLIGSGLTQRMGFAWACTFMGFILLLHITAIFLIDLFQPRQRAHPVYTELTAVSVPLAESADD